MDPQTVDGLVWWQFKGLLGLDRTDGGGSFGRAGSLAAVEARAAMAERRQRLSRLSQDYPEAAADRKERALSRNERRAAQRADPEWRKQVKANKSAKKTPKPERVVQSDVDIDEYGGDILIVR